MGRFAGQPNIWKLDFFFLFFFLLGIFSSFEEQRSLPLHNKQSAQELLHASGLHVPLEFRLQKDSLTMQLKVTGQFILNTSMLSSSEKIQIRAQLGDAQARLYSRSALALNLLSTQSSIPRETLSFVPFKHG